MNPNIAGVMPQAVAVWCERAGHRVHFVCYTGMEDLATDLSGAFDLVFVAAFTSAAQFSYALSTLLRRRGAVTALGGPHARCYPDDARRYFDYVFGFTDRAALEEVLCECAPHRPLGRHMAAEGQPTELPGVEERWKFIHATITKAWGFQLVPMIGSIGCPYTCDFCIDAAVPYRALSFDQLRRDLRFLRRTLRHPRVGWHDPNFGVRFDDFLDAVEDAVPPGSVEHVAESSLSLLSEPHLRRMRRNGFTALLPGIESWFAYNNKSKAGGHRGEAKLRQVAEHVNLILRYIPYVQANFILGLDCDAGAEPFELTKRFVDLVPGAYPALSPLIAYGELAPLNLQFQRDDRVLPLPFHFLNNRHTNLRLRNYSCTEFYRRVHDLHRYAFSGRAIARRFTGQAPGIAKWLNVLRGASADGRGRARYYGILRRRLARDRELLRFLEGAEGTIPAFFRDQLRRDLGPFWAHLTAGALEHEPNAFRQKVDGVAPTQFRRGTASMSSARALRKLSPPGPAPR